MIPPDVPLLGSEWYAAWLLMNWSWSALLDCIVGVAAIFLAWRQLALMNVQSAVMGEQTKLANIQNAIAQKQLELGLRQDELLMQRAELWVRFQPVQTFGDDLYTRFKISVLNTGTRGTNNIYIHLSTVSANINNFDFVFAREDAPKPPTEYQDFNGVQFAMVHMTRTAAFYPGRLTLVGELRFIRSHPDRPMQIEWQIASADGAFPALESADTVRSQSGLLGIFRLA